MFKEKINSWNNSKRDKACKMKYLHELNDSMMQISELKLIIPELSEPPVRTLGATIPENESHIFR